jgi:hypothetical protein
LAISSGELTLDAQGDPNAVFIFQMASTLITTSGRQVILTGGARAANVFWQVGSSATLGTGSVFKGTIMALASITVTTGVNVEGRLLARTAAVTLDSDNIALPSSAGTGTTVPTVSSIDPANGATGFATSGNIAASFSETMDSSTISTTTFTLKQGTTAVAGTVSYAGGTATFDPSSTLAPSTTYTATVTTGAKDLTGTALASDFSWSFTTAGGSSGGLAPVALGSASTFAVLGASTVTSTGATTVNGNLGLSPGTAVTGFPPGAVNGTLHVADAAAAQAQADLTAAYNDAATRTGAITVAGNIGGQTLTPGVYSSSSSLAISSGDLTLDAQGNANAVFIFQMGSTLTTISGHNVILSGGAQAANVFWQVGSSATLGTGSVFKGNILALASITVTTGATVEGRLLARTAAVTLDSNTITIPTSSATAVVQSAAILESPAVSQSAAILESAALPTGPYTDDAGQSVDLATKTITVPLSGNRFYRIRADTAHTITSITIADGAVVISYH